MKKSRVGPQSTVSTSSSSSGAHVDADVLKYKGVRKRKWGKWVSEIRLPNSRDRIWLGSYDSPIKAARAFDAAQFCLRGKSANYNFPNNPPDIITRPGLSMAPNEIQAIATRFANQEQPLDEPEVGGQCTAEISSGKNEDGSMTSSVLDGDTSSCTAQIESEVTGVDESFYNLNATLGSGNFGSDFIYFNGFEDFGPVNFGFSELDGLDINNNNNNNSNNNNGFIGEDCYDTSIYQGSFLWNF